MAAIAIQKPIPQVPGSATGMPPKVSLPVSAHCNDGDFVTLNVGTGLIAPSGANPTLVAGVTEHDSNANFGGQLPGPLTSENIQLSLGPSQQNSAANTPAPGFDPSPGYTILSTLKAPTIVELNLPRTVGWVTGGTSQANYGTRVGLNVDGPTGFYIADPTVSNLIGTIIQKPELPGPGGPFGASPGYNGDTGARVIIQIDDTAAQIQGH